MYADSSLERWYMKVVSRGELNCMPYQCAECRKKSSGDPLSNSPTPTPPTIPRPGARSSLPTNPPTPPPTHPPRFTTPPSSPTTSPPPLSPVDGLVTELVRTQGDLRRAQDALVLAESTAALHFENTGLNRRLAEAAAVAARNELASLKVMLTTARAELKIERPRPRMP
eukprot:CAMPEP_0172602974 /NCGR_PEP_ID=MMETSP1068-20121228/23161_1 /TAXON_ID=35684 /ORGANISM="Pseudopedinella elastica, Strain CCMP716" /LENGTH=168 /DNA_ID=CAMNT_0013404521 /DNA_START=212 /DNA_END=714 /DNA_ORIENTATION=+